MIAFGNVYQWSTHIMATYILNKNTHNIIRTPLDMIAFEDFCYIWGVNKVIRIWLSFKGWDVVYGSKGYCIRELYKEHHNPSKEEVIMAFRQLPMPDKMFPAWRQCHLIIKGLIRSKRF